MNDGFCRFSVSEKHHYEVHDDYFWCRDCGRLIDKLERKEFKHLKRLSKKSIRSKLVLKIKKLF